MPNAQERKQALVEHKVITDVLPGNLDLSYDLTVKWPNATLEKPGEELGREDTQPEPTLHLIPTVRMVLLQHLCHQRPNIVGNEAARATEQPRAHHV